LRLPFPATRRSMGILRPIVQISTLPVLDAGKQVTLGHALAPQLVGHDDPRHLLQTFQQASEEALRDFGIAAFLKEDVEHDAILVHGTPQIIPHALDQEEHPIHVPLVAGSRPPTAQAVGEALAEFPPPAPNRLIRDDNASFHQKQRSVPQAETEHMIQPASMAVSRRESDDGSADRLGLHAASLLHLPSGRRTRLP
jgi:hypothetical protein